MNDVGTRCASQSVCGVAMRLAGTRRAAWIAERLSDARSSGSRSRRVLPFCLNQSAAAVRDESFTVDHLRSLAAFSVNSTMHVVFIDDRPRPSWERMLHVARLGVGSDTRFLALLRGPSAELRNRLAAAGMGTIDIVRLPEHVRCIHSGLHRLVPSQAGRLGASVLLKPMLHWILPKTVERAVVLDTDVLPLRSLDGLAAEFALMRASGAVIGLVREQSSFYDSGQRMPPGIPGFNGGVQLHDVARLRRASAWGLILDALQAGLLYNRIGWHADQHIYTGAASLFPHLFHTVGCQWNRQLGSWTMSGAGLGMRVDVQRDLVEDARVHACPASCAMLHMNGVKCAVDLLQRASGACATLEALLRRLQTGEREANRGLNASDCPDRWQLAQQRFWSHRRGYVEGLRKWFGSCCRPSLRADGPDTLQGVV